MNGAGARRYLLRASVIRLTFGVTGLIAPERLCALCGMPAEAVTEETRFLMRAFATRDLVLALQHLSATRAGDRETLAALDDAAVTGAADGISILTEIARRGAVRGGMRAGAVFAVTDGIGFPLVRLLARGAR